MFKFCSSFSGASVSKIRVFCRTMFFIFDIRKMRSILPSRVHNSDLAACAVNGA